MSEIDRIYKPTDALEIASLVTINAASELAALRAIIKEQEQDIENIKHREAVVVANYQRTVAAQARQLEEAREIVDQSISDLRGLLSMNDDDTVEEIAQNIAGKLMRWLAANAPEQEQTR
jgi:hypothetical protein